MGLGFWSGPNICRRWLYFPATKTPRFIPAIICSGNATLPTLMRQIDDRNSFRISFGLSRLPKRADWGRRTWVKVVMAWSTGFDAARLGSSLNGSEYVGQSYFINLSIELPYVLSSHTVAHMLSIAEPSDKGSDTTIFTGNNKSGEDNSNSREILYWRSWWHYPEMINRILQYEEHLYLTLPHWV